MPVNNEFEPFGLALQADVVTLQHGLTTVLGIINQALADENAKAEDLRTALTLAKDEIVIALRDERAAAAFVASRGMGGFGGEPEIEWGPADQK